VGTFMTIYASFYDMEKVLAQMDESSWLL